MLSCKDLIALALQDARRPGFTDQAGKYLNIILRDLCYKRDLQQNVTTGTVILDGTPTGPSGYSGYAAGIGPYPLPSDYLRMVGREVNYSAAGTPYRMVQDELAEIDRLALNPQTPQWPTLWASDLSTSPPGLYVWPSPVGTITLNVRYYKLQPDIHNPEKSNSIPWFPDQAYLRSRLVEEFLNPRPPDKLLQEYLELEGDTEDRAVMATLDRRQFRPRGRGVTKPQKGFDW